jgi:hypothetical protein
MSSSSVVCRFGMPADSEISDTSNSLSEGILRTLRSGGRLGGEESGWLRILGFERLWVLGSVVCRLDSVVLSSTSTSESDAGRHVVNLLDVDLRLVPIFYDFELIVCLFAYRLVEGTLEEIARFPA